MTHGFWNVIGAAFELRHFTYLVGNDLQCFAPNSPYNVYWTTIRPNILVEFDRGAVLIASAVFIYLAQII
jgi:hypothetical protein